MDWAMQAGFLLSGAGSVKDLVARNAAILSEGLVRRNETRCPTDDP